MFSLLLALHTSSGWAATALEDCPSLSFQEIVAYAREILPHEGQLHSKNGFVYLKVDDAYIHALFPMLGLASKGFREPPYFRRPQPIGAHISVFYQDENVSPKEVGQTFHFELEDIEIIHTKNAIYAVLQVKSPELEQLRKKYGLRPKLHGHEFHISLAKKTRGPK